MNHTDHFILQITDKFQLNLLNPTDRNISQENLRVLEKFFLECDPLIPGITQDGLHLVLFKTNL
jgi:hypothetical protein